MRRITIPVIAALCILSTGCDPDPESWTMLMATTGPPPTRTATVVNDGESTIRLSQGIAMGVGCYAFCPEQEEIDPCENATVTSEDPGTISAAPAHYFRGRKGGFVLSGHRPGISTVTIQSACGSRSYNVVVLPP